MKRDYNMFVIVVTLEVIIIGLVIYAKVIC